MKRHHSSTSKRIASLLAAAGIALAAALSNASGAQADQLSMSAVAIEAEVKPQISAPKASIGWGGCGTCGK
jgi:hypothetical protein